MARYSGVVGFVLSSEGEEGVWKEAIVEKQYFGNLIQNNRRLQDGLSINPDISIQNSISFVADEWANGHIFAIRYVSWAGSLWVVSNVDVQRPRLVLRLGAIYNGPTPEPSDVPGDTDT